MERWIDRGDSRRRAWPFLCLLVAIAVFLSLDQSIAVQANNPAPQYVANATDTDFDCGAAHAPLGGHCCAGVACSAYGQLEATSATSNDRTSRHPLPIAQRIHITRSLRPNLPPPQHSNQA